MLYQAYPQQSHVPAVQMQQQSPLMVPGQRYPNRRVGVPPANPVNPGNRSLMRPRLTPEALLEPRVTHLEETIKQILDRLASLPSSSSEEYGFFNAKVTADTIEFPIQEDNPSLIPSVDPLLLKKGETISVSYPQIEIRYEDSNRVVMRRRKIDPETADIEFTWVITSYPDEEGDSDIHYIGEFRVT